MIFPTLPIPVNLAHSVKVLNTKYHSDCIQFRTKDSTLV